MSLMVSHSPPISSSLLFLDPRLKVALRDAPGRRADLTDRV